MIRRAKKFYDSRFAGAILFTAETLLALMLFLVAFYLFLFVAKMVFLDHKEEFDASAFHFLSRQVSSRNNGIMLFISELGNYQFLIVANVLLFCWAIFVRKHKWYSIKVGSIALSSVLLMLLLKQWFNRQRPPVPLLDPAIGLSFPSGHAMSSVTFYGLLIYFIWNRKDINRSYRILILTAIIVLILSIGLSRIYLRVHYASDVIGGFCAGTIWLILVIWVIRHMEFYSKNKINKQVQQV
ncbi:MAG: phosphatase family protein [Sphingobacteriaceae bacterium]|jgi:undecaprenyl-diphosphatase|nr:phosphatase family protein [Sphingobacteriaceae bacterium]